MLFLGGLPLGRLSTDPSRRFQIPPQVVPSGTVIGGCFWVLQFPSAFPAFIAFREEWGPLRIRGPTFFFFSFRLPGKRLFPYSMLICLFPFSDAAPAALFLLTGVASRLPPTRGLSLSSVFWRA